MSDLAMDNEITKLLQQLLLEARAGRIMGLVAITSPTSENYGVRVAGSNPCSLFAGCGRAQALLLKAMDAPAPIVKPNALGSFIGN